MDKAARAAKTSKHLMDAEKNRTQLVKAAIFAIDFALADYTNRLDKYRNEYNYHFNDEYLFNKYRIFNAAIELLKFLTLEEIAEVFSEPHCNSAKMLELIRGYPEFDKGHHVPGVEISTLLTMTAIYIVQDGLDIMNFKLIKFFINYCDCVDYKAMRSGVENDLDVCHYHFELPYMWDIKCIDVSRMNYNERRDLHILDYSPSASKKIANKDNRLMLWCAVRLGDPTDIFVAYANRIWSSESNDDDPDAPS